MAGSLAKDFHLPDQLLYLATAGESLPLRTHKQALQRYLDDKSKGQSGHANMFRVLSNCRRLAANLLDTNEEVAFLSSTNQALTGLVHALALRSGDNIVVSEIDFVSNRMASLPLAGFGVETRIIPAESGCVDPSAYYDFVDSRTRLVILSLVSHWSGFRHDLKAVSEAVRARGALLAVDATQALGLVPVSFEFCDVIVASTYKWLLGIPGVALMCIQPHLIRKLNPTVIGWQGVRHWVDISSYEQYANARVFEMGFPNFAGLYVLENALCYLLAQDISWIWKKTSCLMDVLLDELATWGLEILTPYDCKKRAGILSIRTTAFQAIGEYLFRNGVCVSASDGRLRISPYAYNDEKDISVFIRILHRIRNDFSIS